MAKTDRSAAARKADQTKKRKAAGKKATVTRRRKVAARKAAATRRAKREPHPASDFHGVQKRSVTLS